MTLSPSCSHMATVGFKGLKTELEFLVLALNLQSFELEVCVLVNIPEYCSLYYYSLKEMAVG